MERTAMTSPTTAVKLFGTDEPAPGTRVLHAGPLSAELDAGSLRYVCYDGAEAIRAIAYVVRDEFWGTFNPALEDFTVEETANRFVVRYRATCGSGDMLLSYEATITGTSRGDLVFSADAVPQADFLTNRTGFVVLHPITGVSGAPVTVKHVDGTVVETAYPSAIDPKQPIDNVRALTHNVVPGLTVTCTMNGDIFEMEDQRNWTDASYKTYVRPIDLPFPYTLPAGETLHQSVTLRFEGAGEPDHGVAATARPPVSLSIGAENALMPAFGMALEARHGAAARAHSESLRPLRPAFLSLYLDMRTDDPVTALGDAAALANDMGAEARLEVVVPGAASEFPDRLRQLADTSRAAGLAPSAVTLAPEGDMAFIMPGTEFPDTKEFALLFAAARAAFPDAAIGGGSLVYFTELNRKPPPTDTMDFIAHPTSALVHAADDRSITESLETLPFVFRSTRALFPSLEYRVGPGSIGSRTSPFGNEPTPNPDAQRLTMARADPRQRGLLGTAWHLGYAAHTAACGVNSVTLGASVGEFGLLHTPADYAQPWFDEAGGLFPVWHVMRSVYAASGRPSLAVNSADPRNIQALAWHSASGTEVWITNLSGDPKTVRLDGIPTAGTTIAQLDESTFETCAAGPSGLDTIERPFAGDTLDLGPYATARLRGTE